MKVIPIQQLIDSCIEFFRTKHYTEHSLARYKSVWRNGIQKFMDEKGISDYTLEIGSQYIMSCESVGGFNKRGQQERIHSVLVLNEFFQTSSVRSRMITPVSYNLNGEIGTAMEKFISSLVESRRTKTTIAAYRRYLHGFLTYLTLQGISSIRSVHDYHCYNYLSNCQGCKHSICQSLRVMFRYFYKNGIIEDNIEESLKAMPTRKPERVLSFYSSEEIIQFEDCADLTSKIGKRNYAILLLSSRLGLRSSDIANLKFSELDWDNNLIKFITQKTGQYQELPLLPIVGNAIIDYLKNSRPNIIKSEYVFLQCKTPYCKISPDVVYNAVSGIISASGIDTEHRHHGAHSMRHSFATTLLKQGTLLPVISEVLAHRNTQSTTTYLKIDMESLLQCALPVPPISEDFYNQKGGVFYV
ncbi:tyrosine-type recombinase/integrase [Bacteroides sp. 51]|uniref:tyrosine-type recombinase/integrase n=1 Tax=Bacteroides sp. 51 TaxID=2302938 RepID=UPI0013D326D0|nr:tyrosine-type recombinase/integrase [Bacteroides sp. 51]